MPPFRVFIEHLEEARRPIDIVSIRTDRNKAQRIFTVTWNPRSVTTVGGGILLGRHVAAATPALIAHSPKVNVEGLAVTIRGAQSRQSISLWRCGGVRRQVPGGSVAVLNFLIKVARGLGANVGGQIGFATDKAACPHEL